MYTVILKLSITCTRIKITFRMRLYRRTNMRFLYHGWSFEWNFLHNAVTDFSNLNSLGSWNLREYINLKPHTVLRMSTKSHTSSHMLKLLNNWTFHNQFGIHCIFLVNRLWCMNVIYQIMFVDNTSFVVDDTINIRR